MVFVYVVPAFWETSFLSLTVFGGRMSDLCKSCLLEECFVLEWQILCVFFFFFFFLLEQPHWISLYF